MGGNVVGWIFAVRFAAHYRCHSVFLLSQGELIKLKVYLLLTSSVKVNGNLFGKPFYSRELSI